MLHVAKLLVISFSSIALIAGCQNSNHVVLTIDFSKSSTWNYLLGVDIKGTAVSPDSQRDFSSSARINLVGQTAAHDHGAVQFATKDVRIISNFLGEMDRDNLRMQFENMQLSFSPHEGALYVPDTSSVPIVNIGGWDLFRSFTKVIPVLPQGAVLPGATWDRERHFPIETTQGSASGHLYQSFAFDSISYSDKVKHAHISWLFSYKIEIHNTDSASVLKSLPLNGSGKGSAILDLTQKRLVKADATFDVPPMPAVAPQPSVGWNESVHLELVN